jgi:hypothetical protein
MAADVPRLAAFARPGAETCEHVGPGAVYWSRGPLVLVSDDLEGPLRHHARLPRPFLRRLLAATRLGRRLARETFYNILPLADGSLFYTYATEIGFISPKGYITPLTGRARAHRVLRGGAAVLPDGSVVFGEYFDNAVREAVRLYRVWPGETEVTEIYRFAPGAVRHVHSVRWDPVSERAIVCTGDLDSECRIIAFSPDFATHEPLGAGSEDWRTISPQFAPEAIYFGTDAQFTPNRLMRYDRATGALSELAEVNGPVFYSAALPGGWIFATTAELCPSQTSPEAILYYIDAASEAVHILARFEKDRLSTRYFQFGIFNLPLSDTLQVRLPISGVALKELDAKFIELRHE